MGCQAAGAWRDAVRDIFLTGLNGQAALPMSLVFGLALVMALLDAEARKSVIFRFLDSSVFAWGGWLACVVFSLSFIFCWKTIIASKDAQIKMLEQAKTPKVARQMELNLQDKPSKSK